MANSPAKPLTAEYVLLLAMLISIGALGTDIMLPALDDLGAALDGASAAGVHYVITAFILGTGLGQLIAGPLSDSYGRKPVIFLGYAIFTLGCVLSYLTDSWALMLAARVLQGVGASAPRIVTVAIIRDGFEGRAMARVMSIIMAAFIIVPILAPSIGLGLIKLGGWRLTFLGLAVLSIGVSIWFALRQEETLARADRHPFRLGPLFRGLQEIFHSPVALGYTLASGLIMGVFFAYLGSAQQIFEGVYQVGDLFPAYFALAAASLGVSSLVNASLVMRFGMHRLTLIAFAALTLLSFAAWAYLSASGALPFGLFLGWLLATFFCVGITFGNLTTLSLEPLGHIAGLAAAFVGALATFIAVPLAAVISGRIDGSAAPLVAGFALLGLASLPILIWTGRRRGTLS